jgi:KaiC/GvpD/RAD55 family RecA-like ATPase
MSERGIDIKQYVEDRLQEWGTWAKKTELPRLGYKSNSNVESIIGKSSGEGVEIYDDASAEAMDKLINQLKREFPREGKAIIVYYSTTQDKPYMARKLSISIRTLSDRLKSGKTYLAGCLAHKVSGD